MFEQFPIEVPGAAGLGVHFGQPLQQAFNLPQLRTVKVHPPSYVQEAEPAVLAIRKPGAGLQGSDQEGHRGEYGAQGVRQWASAADQRTQD